MALGFSISTPSRHPANQRAYNPAKHQYNKEYVNPKFWELHLRVLGSWDLFASLPFAPFIAPPNVLLYKWTVIEVSGPFSKTIENSRSSPKMSYATVRVPRQGTFKVTLETKLNDGTSRIESREYRLRDLLVVSIGDSFSSGQGNPDIRAIRSPDDNALCKTTTVAMAWPKLKGKIEAFLRSLDQQTVGAIEALPYIGKAAAAIINGVGDVRGFIVENAIDITSDAVSYIKNGAVITVKYIGEGAEEVLGWFGIGDGGEEPKPTRPAGWQESKAYRSYRSAPSRAAKFMERDSEYGADRITFLSFARTGSEIVDGLLGPRTVGGKSIDHWIGNRGQIQEARDTIGSRRIDALIISIGGNDAGFSMSLTDLVVDDLFHRDVASRRKVIRHATDMITQSTKLPARFDELHRLISSDLKPAKTFIYEYPVGLFTKFDAAGEAVDGSPCGVFEHVLELDLSLGDGAALRKVGRLLNGLLKQKAKAFGWTYVDGIERDFNGHGYCATRSYFVSAEESCINQGDFEGMMHPNDRGLEMVRGRLVAALAPELFVGEAWLVPSLHVMMH